VLADISGIRIWASLSFSPFFLVAASSDEGNYKDDRMHGFGRYLSSDGDCCEFLFIFFA
jgi:hypothetical protein